jgi:hypothetical protein
MNYGNYTAFFVQEKHVLGHSAGIFFKFNAETNPKRFLLNENGYRDFPSKNLSAFCILIIKTDIDMFVLFRPLTKGDSHDNASKKNPCHLDDTGCR